MRTDSDIAIVGAGPAGAWAAYRLARAGARVAIFDGSHPPEKPCGGGVTGRALRVIADGISDVSAVPIEAAVFEFDAAPHAVVPLRTHGSRAGGPRETAGVSPDVALVVTSRRDFDAALLGAAIHAGATHVAERVIDVGVADTRAVIATGRGEHRAGFLLGADGANSLVRRRLHGAYRRDQLSIATGFFAQGVSERRVRIAMVARPPGYIWSFPRQDHLAIGICAQADAARSDDLRRHVRGWIERSRIAPGARLTPYSWPIPSLSQVDLEHERPAGDRWSLLGDAAGLVDPLSREGIYFALRSADLAVEALRREAAPAGRGYVERLRDEIYPELQRAARFKQRFFRPPFMRLLLRSLAASERIRVVMADLVAGEQPYRGLKRRLLGTFEWRLAWNVLLLDRGV